MPGKSDNKEMRVAAVIVAAGRGERAGQSVEGPKQYRKIGGEAVLAHTMRAFLDCPLIDHVVVVIHKEDNALFALALGDHAERVTAVTGGPTRQEFDTSRASGSKGENTGSRVDLRRCSPLYFGRSTGAGHFQSDPAYRGPASPCRVGYVESCRTGRDGQRNSTARGPLCGADSASISLFADPRCA